MKIRIEIENKLFEYSDEDEEYPMTAERTIELITTVIDKFHEE
jgi:hypothetical protein